MTNKLLKAIASLENGPQLERVLDRAARWRADNVAILRRIFDASAARDYEKQEWEDLYGQEYAEHFIIRRIRELVTNDLMYLTVLRSYIETSAAPAGEETGSSDASPPVELGVQADPGVAVVDIFISHSSADVEVAEALVALLRAALPLRAERIRCTSVEGYKLPAGATTDDQLRVEIYQANAFIGLVTASSMESAYVLFELGARWAAKKHLIPLLAAGATPKALRGPLGSYNALSSTSAADLHQLLSNLAAHLGLQLESAAAYQRALDTLVIFSRDKTS